MHTLPPSHANDDHGLGCHGYEYEIAYMSHLGADAAEACAIKSQPLKCGCNARQNVKQNSLCLTAPSAAQTKSTSSVTIVGSMDSGY